MNIKEILQFLKITIENAIIALSKSIREHTFEVKLNSNKVEFTNELPKVFRVKEIEPQNNKKEIETSTSKLLKAIEVQSKTIIKELSKLTPHKLIEVTNLKDLPKPSNSVKVLNPQKSISVNNFYELQKEIGKFMKLVSGMKLDPKIIVPEIKVPDVYVPEIKIPTIKNEVVIDKLEKLISNKADKYVPVRLTNGKKFYEAVSELKDTIVTAGSSKSYAFQDTQGERTYGLVDSDRHLQVDVLNLTSILQDILTKLDTVGGKWETVDEDNYSSTIIYMGQIKNGEWQFKRIQTSGTVVSTRIANVSNNPLVTDYDTAFDNRTTLTYNKLSDL